MDHIKINRKKTGSRAVMNCWQQCHYQ